MPKKPEPGPTGDFPHGKLSPDDEGGINVALRHFDAPDGTRMVRLDFGKPLAWLSLPQDQAIAFAMTILKHATGAERGFVLTEVDEIDAEDLERRGQGDSGIEPRRQ